MDDLLTFLGGISIVALVDLIADYLDRKECKIKSNQKSHKEYSDTEL